MRGLNPQPPRHKHGTLPVELMGPDTFKNYKNKKKSKDIITPFDNYINRIIFIYFLDL